MKVFSTTHNYGQKPLFTTETQSARRQEFLGRVTPFICRYLPANERFEFLCVLCASVVNTFAYLRNPVPRSKFTIRMAYDYLRTGGFCFTFSNFCLS